MANTAVKWSEPCQQMQTVLFDMYIDFISFYLTEHTGGPLYGPKEKRDGNSNMEERVSPQVDTTGTWQARRVREVSGEFLLIST
jgi:hypothetical protein